MPKSGPTWYAHLDTGGFEKGARQLDRDMQGLHTRATAVGTAVGMLAAQGLTAGIRGLSSAVRTGWQEMQETAAAGAKLDAVLRSTHQAAGMNRAEMDRLNAVLQQHSTIEGDVIANAQALMLTFTKVGKETFPAAMRSAMDMSRTFNLDLSRASVTLGKALQDPAKGITALTRIGVSFTAGQKEQVKALVETGKAQQAQALILREVNRQVAGQEERYSRTLPGALEKARRGYKDLAENGVALLEPTMLRAANAVNDHVLPALASLQTDLVHIATADIPLARKLELAAKRLSQTGAPAAVREWIEKGIVSAASHGPRLMLDAFAAAPWQGQAVLGALLLKKFGPAFTLLGKGAGAAIGTGSAGGLVGKAGPVPVYVVNSPGGLPGGVPGAVPAGRFGRIGGAAATYGPLALGAGLIAGGMALDSFQQGHGIGLLGLPSAAEQRREVQRLTDATYQAAKRGRQQLAARLRSDSALGMTNPFATDRWAEEVTAGMDRISQVIRTSTPKTRRSAKLFTDQVLEEIQQLPPRARNEAAATAVEMASTLERRGQVARGTTRRLMGQVSAEFGVLPTAARRAADLAGSALDRIRVGLSGIRTGAQTAATAIQSVGAAATTAARFRTGFHTGGITPGPYLGVDDRLVALAGNEAILTPTQQAMIPGGRGTLMRIFQQTGGRLGGGYADGGWVFPAPGARRGGGPGAGTHSYNAAPNNWQSDTAWDLMGSDGMAVVAAHDGVVGAVRPFSNDSRFWGHAVYLDVPGGQLYYKHLKDVTVRSGQRVAAGTVLGHLGTGVNGGPHLHLGATNLGILSQAVNGSASAAIQAGSDLIASGGKANSHFTPSTDRAPEPTPFQALTSAVLRTMGGGSARDARGIAASAIIGAGDRVTGVSDRTPGVGLSSGEQRGVGAAARAARGVARARHLDPQTVAKAGQDAERAAEVKTLKRHHKRLGLETRKLLARKKKLLADLQRLGLAGLGGPDSKSPSPKAIAARKKARTAILVAINTVTAEVSELREAMAEIQGRLADLAEEVTDEQYQLDYEASQQQTTAADGGDASGGGGGGATDPGPSAGDYLDAQAAEAALTPELGDDLAAAEAIQQAAEAAYYQAKAAGDPRDVAQAARQLKAARDQVESLRQQIAGAQTPAPTELSASQKAALDYAGNADSWIRTLLGSGDIGGRSATAWGGGLNINIDTLHPGDPSTLAAIQQAVTRAINATAYIPSSLVPSGA